MSIGALQTPPAVVPELVPYLLSLNAALAELQQSGVSINQAQLEQAVSVAVAAVGASAGSGSSYTPDMSVPPALSGLLAVGSFGSVILSWDAIPYGNHAYVNIYRSSVDVVDLSAGAVGTSRSLVYNDAVPSDTEWFYWICAVSKEGVQGPVNQVAGTAGRASLDPAYVLDILIGGQTDPALHRLPFVVGDVGGVEMVGLRGQLVVDGTITGQAIQADTIGANHISVVSLGVINANMGVLNAGLVQSPDQTFTIDLAQKEIMITGPNGQASDDYMVLRNGVIEAWKYIAGQHVLGKALTHIESGTASSNTTVQIPGYFEVQPNIQVSPQNIQVFSAASGSQDQTLECKADSVFEYATGQWQFDAYAALTLDAGGGNQLVNWQSGSSSADLLYSTVQTTPVGVVSFDVNVSVSSVRGTGTAPNYYYRQVALWLHYRAVGDSEWIVSYFTVVYLPADIVTLHQHQLSASGLTAGAYEFRVQASYSDQGGAIFTSGTGGYEYDSYTTPSVSDYEVQVDAVGIKSVTASLEAYSPPSGWSVYDVVYNYKTGHYLQSSDYWVEAYSSGRLPGGSVISPASPMGSSGAPVGGNLTFSLSYYNSLAVTGTVGIAGAGPWYLGIAEGRFSDVFAVINIRRTITNSIIQSNNLNIVDYDYTTGSSVELSAGTLNWMAIGR